MFLTPSSPPPPPAVGWRRTIARALLVSVVCALCQALLPRANLGTGPLAPINLGLGLLVVAAVSRRTGDLVAALVGTLLGLALLQWEPLAGVPGLADPALAQRSPEASLAMGLVTWVLLGAQTLLATWLLQPKQDAEVMRLDMAARLKRLVLVAAPSAALLGALGSGLITMAEGLQSPWPFSRAGWAHASGRWVADWAGIVVGGAMAQCLMGQPDTLWRPRRRLVAWPLLAALALILPGLDQIAQRDDRRLEQRFEFDAQARRRQLQQLLNEPTLALAATRGLLAAGGPALTPEAFDRLVAGWPARLPGLRLLGWVSVGEPPTESGPVPPGWQVQGREGANGSLALLGLAEADGRLKLSPALVRGLAQATTADSPVALRLPADARGEAGNLLVLVQPLPLEPGGSPRLALAVVDLQRQLRQVLPAADDQNLRICLFDNPPSAPRNDRTTRPGSPANMPAWAASAGIPNPLDLRQADALAMGQTLLAGPPGCVRAPTRGAYRARTDQLQLADRPLALLTVEPSTAENRIFTAVWMAGLPSAAGLGMLAALLLALSGRLLRIEDRVQERTAALTDEIDERRQAERALSTSEQRFRAIFESVNIGVTLVDNEGRLAMVNPAFCAMMGCSAEGLVGRALADIRLPDVDADDGTARALGGSLAHRQRYLTADGRVLQVAASVRQLQDAAGQAMGTVGALHDLTPVLRLRDAERERDEAAIASRTKSEFLARLSHELRTPLAAIVSFAQLVDETAGASGDAPRLYRTLARIRQAGWQVLDIVNDVLDLSRMEAGSLRLSLGPVRLADTVQEAVAMLEPNARQAGVEVTLSLSPQAEWVQADGVRLRQMLLNLVGNAIKYNRRAGKVVVRTLPGGADDLVVEIEDTGQGMGAEQLSTLFKAYQAPPATRGSRSTGQDASDQPASGQGAGVGLAISQRLAALMNGSIEASSRLGQGSLFRLRLPKAGGPTEPRTEVRAGLPLRSPASVGQVLYIERNPQDQQAMRVLLQQRPGVTLHCAATAAEGMAQAGEADVVLLDLDLPDGSGLALLLQIGADTRWRRLPLIVVSNERRPERIDQCFDAGATGFFSKPVDGPRFLQALDEALQGL